MSGIHRRNLFTGKKIGNDAVRAANSQDKVLFEESVKINLSYDKALEILINPQNLVYVHPQSKGQKDFFKIGDEYAGWSTKLTQFE